MGKKKSGFGANQEEIWRQLVAEINQRATGMRAEFIDGGTWKGDLVRAQVGEWTVTLDTFTTMVMAGEVLMPVSYTRLRAPYVNPDGFRFKIYRASFFSGFGKMLGMQDIETGQPVFDQEFVIQGTDEKQVRRLFSNPEIVALVAGQPEFGTLEVKDDEGWFGAKFPEGVDELNFMARGVIADGGQLRQLFDLFAAILNRLCAIGAAYADDPQMT